MSLILFLAAAAQAAPVIVVTGSREPLEADRAPVSSTVFNEEMLEDLALPAAADVLRLSPGVAVSSTGPRGTQTQVRIRGAEANHALLFVDGIRFNDPAAGNEARFELLTTDLLSRIELVRGPQSALWGSEAIGGVIGVETPDPLRADGLAALGEIGSLESSRLFGRYSFASETTGIMAAAGWQRSDGINSFGADGERDGFENLSMSVKAHHRKGPLELGAVGHWIQGESEFDGFDPLSFLRADTLDETRNRIGAIRGWAAYAPGSWRLEAQATYLDSANRNRLAGAPLNSTFGDRLSLGAQIARQLGRHRLIAAVEHEAEDFRARDTAFFGGTDQDRSRHLTALVAEWRAEWVEGLSTDIAVRHDAFSAFADATTIRATMLYRPAADWAIHAGYGEGIAQPTFYDLFGFFPGSFIGNPDLQPESSQSWEVGARWDNGRFHLGVNAFSAHLNDEIVDTFDPATFLSSTANAEGRSRRDGVELEAGWQARESLNLSVNYTYLDADEQRTAGAVLVREVRRPRHSANFIAHGSSGRLAWGTSLAYVGARQDTDFDLFPAQTVRLDDYWLASLHLAYRLRSGIELYGRVENGFDADYQDVVGYNTPGRTVYAGLRVALDR